MSCQPIVRLLWKYSHPQLELHSALFEFEMVIAIWSVFPLSNSPNFEGNFSWLFLCKWCGDKKKAVIVRRIRKWTLPWRCSQISSLLHKWLIIQSSASWSPLTKQRLNSDFFENLKTISNRHSCCLAGRKQNSSSKRSAVKHQLAYILDVETPIRLSLHRKRCGLSSERTNVQGLYGSPSPISSAAPHAQLKSQAKLSPLQLSPSSGVEFSPPPKTSPVPYTGVDTPSNFLQWEFCPSATLHFCCTQSPCYSHHSQSHSGNIALDMVFSIPFRNCLRLFVLHIICTPSRTLDWISNRFPIIFGLRLIVRNWLWPDSIKRTDGMQAIHVSSVWMIFHFSFGDTRPWNWA